MPRGKKICPSCNSEVGVRVSECKKCGHRFTLNRAKKKAKPFFKERKDFIKRMLGGEKSDDMSLDMMVVTQIFQSFDNNVEFLSKVKPPFKFKGNIIYLRSSAGKEYLRKKFLEFQYNPKNSEIFVDENKKRGEDIVVKKNQTIREFLNGRSKE